MPSSCFIERNLRISGAVLFAIYLVSEISGFMLSRAAIWSFQAHRVQVAETSQNDTNSNLGLADFTLWSQKRVKAYKQALAMKFGAPVAILSVPRIGINEVPVFEGTDDLTLNRGAGLIAGTGLPGESRNVGIAGHRDGFFRRLKYIQVGDQILLEAGRDNFEYKVEEIEIVDPSNVNVLRARASPSLTLVTCYPFYFVGDAPQRYIVHASLLALSRATSSLALTVPQTKMEEMP